MSVTRIARRRRKQHAQGFTHVHRAKRPHYARSGGAVWQRVKK